MTPEEVHEAQELLRAHGALRHNIARNCHRHLSIHMQDDDQNTSDPMIPPSLSGDVLFLVLAMVERRLRALGVTPEDGLDQDCFECGGSGKVPIR